MYVNYLFIKKYSICVITFYLYSFSWENNSFAIDNGKLYLDWEPVKEYGLRALTAIEKGSFIGEYRGRLIDGVEMNSDKDIPRYAFSIPFCEKYIDAFKQGSAMRLINCGCAPNLESVVYIHNWEFKVVFIAAKNIKPKEELLIEYDYTFPPLQKLPVSTQY